MTEFYLITGFLGAGKTTFLKNFIPLFPSRRLHLIINEFGKVGVDGALLKHFDADLDEIDNGSIFCACRLDQFENVLEKALQSRPDVIIVECSGLSDPTNIHRVLVRYPDIEYRGSICLTDAVRLEKVFFTAQVCQRQLAVSSLVLLNKADLASAQQLEKAKEYIYKANPAAHIEYTEFGRIQPQCLSFLFARPNSEKASSIRDITLQKATLTFSREISKSSLEKCLSLLSEATYRMKGFFQLSEGTFFVDCVGPLIQISPWQGEANNKLCLLDGKGMALRRAVKAAAQWYEQYVTEVEL